MEAPHLTALHKKFADRGLVVLAVNAWDEPKTDVARYVRNNRLAHRILLDGAEVASKRYRVGLLPVTFLIDKQGIIVRQLSGFHESDARRIDRWIEEVL